MSMETREAKRTRRGGVVASILYAEPEKSGRGRPKSAQETKRRITLSVLPSLYADVQKIAFVEHRSVSEVFAACMTQYVQENYEKLHQYDAAHSDKGRGIG